MKVSHGIQTQNGQLYQLSVGANKESLSVYLGKEILRLKYKLNATDILIGELDSKKVGKESTEHNIRC